MTDRWVAIDFETANQGADSACALGVAVVEDGTVARARSWLIRPRVPYFDPFHTSIHGIRAGKPVRVLDEREFLALANGRPHVVAAP